MLTAILLATLFQSSHGWLWDFNSTTVRAPSFSTTDNFIQDLTFSLNWLTIPFFVFVMVLGMACWYRRYRLRQHYLAEQRLNNSAAVQYNSAMVGITVPLPASNASSTLPASAYPRQQVMAYDYPSMPPATIACPPYQAQNPAMVGPAAPPSYEDAIKQPVDGQQ